MSLFYISFIASLISYSLNTTYVRSLVSFLAWFLFKIQIVFMQEEMSKDLRNRGKYVKREKKVKEKIYICVWKRKKEK
jgi:hypothetical protein